MTTLKKIYEFKKYKLYEADVSDLHIKGHIFRHDDEDYAVVDIFESRVDYGKDHQQGIRGLDYKLLVTDYPKAVISARTNVYIYKRDEQKKLDDDKEFFQEAFKSFINGRTEIPVKVHFDHKHHFRKTFSGRTTWDAEKKTWGLKFQNSDFDSLEIDIDQVPAGLLEKPGNIFFRFSFLPTSRFWPLAEYFQHTCGLKNSFNRWRGLWSNVTK